MNEKQIKQQENGGKSHQVSEDLDVSVSVKPALEKLRQDQIELIEKWQTGFRDRREILEWIPHLSLCTLGVIKNNILTNLLFEKVNQKILVDDSKKAQFFRYKILNKYIEEAWNQSFERLRDKSREYIEEVDNLDEVPDSDLQRYAAMRPELNELKERQEQTISSLLNGFDNQRDVSIWHNNVIHAGNGYTNRQLSTNIEYEESFKKHLYRPFEDPRKSLFHRVNFAAKYLIPPYNTAVRYTANKTGEFNETTENRLSGGQI